MRAARGLATREHRIDAFLPLTRRAHRDRATLTCGTHVGDTAGGTGWSLAGWWWAPAESSRGVKSRSLAAPIISLPTPSSSLPCVRGGVLGSLRPPSSSPRLVAAAASLSSLSTDWRAGHRRFLGPSVSKPRASSYRLPLSRQFRLVPGAPAGSTHFFFLPSLCPLRGSPKRSKPYLYLLLGWVFLTVLFSAREIDPPISVGGAALEHFGAQLRLLAVFFFCGKNAVYLSL